MSGDDNLSPSFLSAREFCMYYSSNSGSVVQCREEKEDARKSRRTTLAFSVSEVLFNFVVHFFYYIF